MTSVATTFREFLPTAVFLLKFVGIYLIGNFIYGAIISGYEPAPDPVTKVVTNNVSALLNIVGFETTVQHQVDKSTSVVQSGGKNIIAVYEGCNSLAVMIVFIAFVVAFGPWTMKLAWFFPTALAIIYICNLARVSLLYMVAIYSPEWLYYVHKYFFTAAIYGIVGVLWLVWIRINVSTQKA